VTRLLTTGQDFCSLTLVWVQLVVSAGSPSFGVSAKVESKMLPPEKSLVAVEAIKGYLKNEEYQ